MACLKSLLFLVLFETIIFLQVASISQSPPSIRKQPPSDELLFQVSEKGGTDRPFTLECEADGDPTPEYGWTKNGKRFTWSEYRARITQRPGSGTLVVRAPKNGDAGRYQCFASNQWGTASSNAVDVRKAEMGSLYAGDRSLTSVAEEGAPFKMRCIAPHWYPKPRISWLWRNAEDTNINVNSSRITVDPIGTLWFSNVTINDQNWYTCSAYSLFGDNYQFSRKTWLHVLYTNSSDTAPGYQYVTERNALTLRGSSKSLWCIMGGTPLPDIKWIKKDALLPTDVEFTNYGKTLIINNVDFEDEGDYACEASNGIGPPIRYWFHLTVNAAPFFTVEPEAQNATKGDTVEFKCEAGGKPAPEIKWVHNGKDLAKAKPNPRREKVGNKIIIRNITRSDIGNYGCNATNRFGYVYKDVFVNVIGQPIYDQFRDDFIAWDNRFVEILSRLDGDIRNSEHLLRPRLNKCKNLTDKSQSRIYQISEEVADLVASDNRLGILISEVTSFVNETCRLMQHLERLQLNRLETFSETNNMRYTMFHLAGTILETFEASNYNSSAAIFVQPVKPCGDQVELANSTLRDEEIL